MAYSQIVDDVALARRQLGIPSLPHQGKTDDLIRIGQIAWRSLQMAEKLLKKHHDC